MQSSLQLVAIGIDQQGPVVNLTVIPSNVGVSLNGEVSIPLLQHTQKPVELGENREPLDISLRSFSLILRPTQGSRHVLVFRAVLSQSRAPEGRKRQCGGSGPREGHEREAKVVQGAPRRL